MIDWATEMKKEHKDNSPRGLPWIFSGGVLLILGMCVCSVILYAVSGGFSDDTQLALLWLLEFFAVFLMILSLCALIFAVWRMARYRRLRYVLFMGLYFLSGITGAGLIFFGRFIIMTAGGS